MSDANAKCELCGEPMPEGEQMFRYHGHSGPCPKPPICRSCGYTEHPGETCDERIQREVQRINEAQPAGSGTPQEDMALTCPSCKATVVVPFNYGGCVPFVRPPSDAPPDLLMLCDKYDIWRRDQGEEYPKMPLAIADEIVAALRSGSAPAPSEAMRQLANVMVAWDGATDDGCPFCGGLYAGADNDADFIAHVPECPIPAYRLERISALMDADPAPDSPDGKQLLALVAVQEKYERTLRAPSEEKP